MFVAKKKFEALKGSILLRLSLFNDDRRLGDEVLSEHIEQVDAKRKVGDEALGKIVERNRQYVVAACEQGDRDHAALDGRLRESEARIDNLIDSINAATLVDNKNLETVNANITECNERFEKFEAQLSLAESAQANQAAMNQKILHRLEVLGATIVSPSAIYFHYEHDLEVGVTYWLKVGSFCMDKTVQGKWSGSAFTKPDGKVVRHDEVLEVGDIIETPEL